MKRIFGGLNMTWPKMILFAMATGIYTGLVMLVPFLHDTSFQDIGISYEWWVVFAVIVVVNCKKSWEAAFKCFVFFLISQPLVYLVEILFGTLDFETCWRYYRNMWGPMTMLTLPGGFIAYFCKKQNVPGAVILGLGNTIQGCMALHYFGTAVKHFPHHLLTALFCVASIFVMSFLIQKERKNRLISILLPILLVAALVVCAKITGRVIVS